jgi:osmotically-inducible protein OsmY
MKSKINLAKISVVAIVLASGLAACQNDQPTAQDVSVDVPQARVGLDGEYDSSGLAKRVVQALKDDPQLGEISTVYVAQSGSTILLKGTVSDLETLNQIVDLAKGVDGTDRVDASQVTIR